MQVPLATGLLLPATASTLRCVPGRGHGQCAHEMSSLQYDDSAFYLLVLALLCMYLGPGEHVDLVVPTSCVITVVCSYADVLLLRVFAPNVLAW